jgi:transposase
MIQSKEIVRRVMEMVIDKRVSKSTAADLLETSVRTIFNYRSKYMLQGAAGLIDHRRGIYRKVTPEIEKQIVQCKLQKPERSARWIRNRLKLAVSVETVRSKHSVQRACARGRGLRRPDA